MPEQTFLDAIRSGLAEEMRRDSSVYVFGEDVALGGPFGVTKDLAAEFGVNRMVNTPISEGTVMGLAIGAATAGLRPVVEIMFIDFITLAMDQLVNHAAKLHYMSGGQLRIPLTVRVQSGISGAMGAHHSQSLESWLAHVPGLKVIMPSNPGDAKGMLKSAIREDNPVVFIEHRGLYWSKGQVPEGEHVVPIGRASVVRAGDQVTLVALANMIDPALAAADDLALGNISAEVIDPRSIAPLDVETPELRFRRQRIRALAGSERQHRCDPSLLSVRRRRRRPRSLRRGARRIRRRRRRRRERPPRRRPRA